MFSSSKIVCRKRANIKDCLEHPWIKPRRKQDEIQRRQAQINIEQFRSFIARRRWKVQMQCESRTVRTVTTKYRDTEGNIKSKRRAELSGKSVLYEGEYSETDSETELDPNNKSLTTPSTTANTNRVPKFKRPIINGSNSSSSSSNTIRIGNHIPSTSDINMIRRQKLLDIPEVELKAVKESEFNELIDENCCVDDNAMQAKIDDHLSIRLKNSACFTNNTTNESATNENNKKIFKDQDSVLLDKNLISDESKSDEKCDFKVIDSTDEKTGIAIRTSIENKMKSNENVKVCKSDNVVDVQETDDAVVKKITTKTRTTKSVVKTTTTTTTKKGILLTDLQVFSFCVCVCVFILYEL